MKTILIALMFVASLAHANQGQENEGVSINMGAYNPEKIYKALKVAAIAENPGIAGSSRLVKSVGGLSCAKETMIIPNATPTYSCQIDQEQVNFEQIYKALRAKQVNLNPGIAGLGRIQKSVGGLTCIASTLIVPNAQTSYSCEISPN